jgi:hypothetical protein
MRFPLMMLPNLISSLIQANVSMTRIRKFLLRDEIDENQITHQETPDLSIVLDQVDLGWSDAEKSLKKYKLLKIKNLLFVSKTNSMNFKFEYINKKRRIGCK